MPAEGKRAPETDAACARLRRAKRDWQARTNPLLQSSVARPHGRRRFERGDVLPAVVAAGIALTALAGGMAWFLPFGGPLLHGAGVGAAGALGVWGLVRRRRWRRRLSAARAPQLHRQLLQARGLAAALHRCPRVYVDDLKDLLRLAVAEHRPVLKSVAEEPPLYCVIAHGVAYIHVPDAGLDAR
jgi:hypothetical protein